ncbi:Tuberous sclerosis 2 protein-like protein [Yarrowia sp. C11]|nr:Tuberous sclerosis 2 protein-like protein [Yarrowia sp. E02]KAG5372017.1 Tuberous sclerosis 2 protein-like protein [Yarrowia sp. C11]
MERRASLPETNPVSQKSGLGSVFKSLTKGFKSSSTGAPQTRPTVVGGAADQEELVRVLATGTTDKKVEAATALEHAVQTYSVSSIPEIWYAARDLTKTDQPTECRRAGLKLTIACIKQDESATGSRLAYFQSLIENSNLQDFDLQLEVLRVLTDNGKNVFDLYQSGYPFTHILSSWLKRLAAEAQDVRIGRIDDVTAASTGGKVTMNDNLQTLMKLLTSMLQHNFQMFNDDEVGSILGEVVTMCRRTSSKSDIEAALEMFNTVIQSGYVPIKSIPMVLDILCSTYVTIPDMEKAVGQSLTMLCSSHVGHATVEIMFRYLQDAGKNTSGQNAPNGNTLRGTVRFLRVLAENTPPELKLDITMGAILGAYEDSLRLGSANHDLEVCQNVMELVRNQDTCRKITYEDWDSDHSPYVIISRCAEQELDDSATNNQSSVHRTGSIAKTTATGQGSTSLFDRKSSHFETRSRLSKRAGSIFSADSTKDHKETKEDHAASPPEPSKLMLCIKDFVELVSSLERKADFTAPKEQTIQFYLNMAPFLNESSAARIVRHFEDSYLCSPFSSNWEANTELVLDFLEPYWPDSVRVLVLDFMDRLYTVSSEVNDREMLNKLISMLSHTYRSSQLTTKVRSRLLTLLTDMSKSASFDVFNTMLRDMTATGEAPAIELVYSLGRMFGQFMLIQPDKAQLVYTTLVKMLPTLRQQNSVDAYLEACRLFVRLRSTDDEYVYITNPVDMDGLSASFGRNYTGREAECDKPWHFPEDVKFLDGVERNKPCRKLMAGPPGKEPENGVYYIDTSLWFSEILQVISKAQCDWEIYSFVLAHLGPQLSNLALFKWSHQDIKALRVALSEGISDRLPAALKIPKDISKPDIGVAIIRNISSFIGYGDLLSRTDEEYILQALVAGLSSWEKTAIPCIHALVLCCYEFPVSIRRFLPQIFTKFQTKITTLSSSPHILEFLLALSRMPSLTRSFTQDEYKRIFGMAFKYIQHANDLAKMSDASKHQVNYDPTGPDTKSSTDATQFNGTVMSQYLLGLAYNVIIAWFLKLDISKRHFLAKFIVRNLILADGNPADIDPQSLALLDLIQRFAFTDFDLQMPSMMGINAHLKDKKTSTKQWLYGTSVISIQTVLATGETQYIVRRPTGTAIINVNPSNKMVPRQSEQSSEELFSPNYFLLQTLPTDVTANIPKPIALGTDPATTRAVSAIDRIPVVDFHKVGVMYMGPNQKDETEILANQTGSRHYRQFMSSLGTLTRLRDNKSIYTGGLDTEQDVDGEFAYCWRDKISQLVFHATTLMPPPLNPQDTAYASKKRHIGNDYVNVFFDESGLAFDFNTIKSQFNFINIVITPHSANFDKSHIFADSKDEPKTPVDQPTRYYKVRAYRKAGVPAIFAACHLKIISEGSLPDFIRNLVLIASKFATIWYSDGQYVSNWRYRLQQIQLLKEKTVAQVEAAAAEKKNAATDSKDMAASFLEQLQGGGAADNSDDDDDDDDNPSGPVFTEDEDAGNDLPLLKSLDFTSFLN